jgi:hypothetical protein
MYTISNVRMAKSTYPNGFNMNGCRTVGVMFADVIDSDTNAVVYSGTVDMCRGRIEMLGA